MSLQLDLPDLPWKICAKSIVYLEEYTPGSLTALFQCKNIIYLTR